MMLRCRCVNSQFLWGLFFIEVSKLHSMAQGALGALENAAKLRL